MGILYAVKINGKYEKMQVRQNRPAEIRTCYEEKICSFRLFFRENNSRLGESFPTQTLPAAVTVSLIFSFHGDSTPGTNREAGKIIGVRVAETTDMCYRHRFTICHLLPNVRRDKQIIWREFETIAELF